MSAPPPSAQVLVVDDEPDLRTLYELTLLREGYRVDAAGSLAEASAQLAAKKFDAVITDMRLPDGLGLELLQRMFAQQRSERCIVMTAYGSAENAVEALKAGAFDYLTKPVDLKQFRSVVASAIQGTGGSPSRARVPAGTAKPGAAGKGSYTGASQDREGYFQAARSGTLFLDEIGDLPLAMQSKLLRAIQERQVRSLGSTQEDAVDVRIVSATDKDLAADLQAGRFRQDLYYRLHVIEILVPPLRERREDLPALCSALLARIAHESGMPAPPLSEQVLAQLQEHALPGNVRELENLLHRALALSDGTQLQVDFAP